MSEQRKHLLIIPDGAADLHQVAGRCAIVGCMDFLKGIAKAGGIDFFKVGNGRPDTDYAGKGAKVLELLEAGYSFVVCHINSPDEAAHEGEPSSEIPRRPGLAPYAKELR